jgi:hypothetical protein
MNHPKLITLSIDVTQLDKSRFKEIIRKGSGPRAGMKAVFADLVLVATPGGQYGDYIVKQQVNKEERAARVEMPILGNGKVFEMGERQAAAPLPQPQQDDNSEVPF